MAKEGAGYEVIKDADSDKDPNFPKWIFLPPALCDCTATATMYLGLTYTYANSYQILRGSLVIFTAVLSITFLKRRLYVIHFCGCLLVMLGLVAIGLANVLIKTKGDGNSNAPNPLLGDILVVLAQLVAAVQMVVEESLFKRYSIPALQAVGWEGVWGFSFVSILLPILYFVPNPLPGAFSKKHFEDSLDAFSQIANDSPNYLAMAVAGSILSIAFFNYCGVSVTKVLSATTRVVLDSVRTITIWAFSLAVGWQSFNWLTALGMVAVIAGTMVYNKLVPLSPGMARFCLGGAAAEQDTRSVQEKGKVPLLREGRKD